MCGFLVGWIWLRLVWFGSIGCVSYGLFGFVCLVWFVWLAWLVSLFACVCMMGQALEGMFNQHLSDLPSKGLTGGNLPNSGKQDLQTSVPAGVSRHVLGWRSHALFFPLQPTFCTLYIQAITWRLPRSFAELRPSSRRHGEAPPPKRHKNQSCGSFLRACRAMTWFGVGFRGAGRHAATSKPRTKGKRSEFGECQTKMTGTCVWLRLGPAHPRQKTWRSRAKNNEWMNLFLGAALKWLSWLPFKTNMGYRKKKTHPKYCNTLQPCVLCMVCVCCAATCVMSVALCVRLCGCVALALRLPCNVYSVS